ncbi:hypothetical protein TNIN_391921 [Trichonephila inaurata madagascariensis]|uniref:Uncharacterized protein n=1 Tax=Trichonephila inaurata madagascariensis TaxID=2747483 RepID=A0A8X6XA48_9ARAC|nr:hypothetical protein TNIN_391921 [Trichonephila inaurata madagascariensis]
MGKNEKGFRRRPRGRKSFSEKKKSKILERLVLGYCIQKGNSNIKGAYHTFNERFENAVSLTPSPASSDQQRTWIKTLHDWPE